MERVYLWLLFQFILWPWARQSGLPNSFWANIGYFYFPRKFSISSKFSNLLEQICKYSQFCYHVCFKDVNLFQHDWYLREQCELSDWFQASLFSPLDTNLRPFWRPNVRCFSRYSAIFMVVFMYFSNQTCIKLLLFLLRFLIFFFHVCYKGVTPQPCSSHKPETLHSGGGVVFFFGNIHITL